MIFGKVRISTQELAFSYPSKDFNLLEQEEVNPCNVVSSDEVVAAKEL